MQDFAEQQEIMGALADCITEVFGLESCILRAEKIHLKQGETAARHAINLTRLYAARALDIIERSTRKVIAAVAEGDDLRTQTAILRRLAKHDPINTVGLTRQIAQQMIQVGRYTV
jgi:butyryl-CoA dehydrogenase